QFLKLKNLSPVPAPIRPDARRDRNTEAGCRHLPEEMARDVAGDASRERRTRSKLKMEDIKEVNKALKGHTWLKDDEATGCKQCKKEFSISRRKHHCRNCGDIFCNTCSSNELSLPSYPKPVRVCDTCHNLLLQRCSSNCS
ncbi:unnamed protein product, partial [Staurois parvus]